MHANVSAYCVAGIGALVKAVRPTSATSCDLSHDTNVNKETESYEDTAPRLAANVCVYAVRGIGGLGK
jgi:hypothetical protein